jgi:TPR repeat protein
LGKIFVSYRRDDAPGDARSICEQLARSFGAANVFMDVDKLVAGQRFDRELDKALAKCDVLVAVIGSRWMELLSGHVQSGKRDYVRDEIAAALKRDIIVIPVLTGREANMPPLPVAENLPENVRELVLYQKHNVAHESFRRDAAQLVAAIKAVLEDKRGPRPWRTMAATLAGVIALVLAVAVLGDWMNVLGRIRPESSVGTNPPRVAAITNSYTASKKSEDEVRPKAEPTADKAKPVAATGEVTKKAEDEVRKTEAKEDKAKPNEVSGEATKKVTQQAKLAGITDCDQLAASPADNDRPNGVPGVLEYAKIEVAATAACDDAMRRFPEVARFPYQAGRAALARKDYANAEQLFRAAIDKGSAGAFAGLGGMYSNGLGVAKDYAEARILYEKGAARGNSAAMVNLGVLYETGQGVKQDYTVALNLYDQAAKLSNGAAMNNIGAMYEKAHGVPADFEKARNWYDKAVVLGNATAMKNIGAMYENARGVPKDFEQARKWYEKAAALGNVAAMYNIGLLYDNARGVARDFAEARKWFEKAAGQGHADSMSYLGQSYYLGRGTAIDYMLAMDWYEKAARAGNSSALFNLSNLCTATVLDGFQVRSCNEKAAGLGSVNAMYDLGVLYEEGKGVARDPDQARNWYQKAADAGSESAKTKLKNLK